MTVHTKSALIVLGTLLIGIICGALLNGAWRTNRDGRFMGAPSPERFSGFFVERVIRPDAGQRKAIQSVVEGYGPKFEETMFRHRQEIEALIDSLESDMDPLLTDQQKERFSERRNLRTRFKNRRGGRGPRGFGRPGKVPEN